MNTGIFIEFSGNKIKFIIKLDIDLIEKNKKEYFKLDDEILYETDNINFDKTILNNKIKLLNEKIKK